MQRAVGFQPDRDAPSVDSCLPGDAVFPVATEELTGADGAPLRAGLSLGDERVSRRVFDTVDCFTGSAIDRFTGRGFGLRRDMRVAVPAPLISEDDGGAEYILVRPGYPVYDLRFATVAAHGPKVPASQEATSREK